MIHRGVHYALVVRIVGTAWELEPTALAGLLLVGLLYWFGVRKMAAKGRKWPLTRSAAFAGGLFVLGIALLSPLAAQDTRLFSAHVVQHLLLSMAGPALMALGGPITLALQASDRPIQTRILKILHTRLVRVITFPVTTLGIFVLTLFVLYYSPLYELSLRNELAHELIHLHFVGAGMLFFSAVVNIDPHPWRMPHGARMLFTGLTLPAHAFLALALLSASSPLAADWYTTTTGRTVAEVLTDQKMGAGIMWVAGDLLSITCVAIIVLQWSRQDERSQSREDAYVDSQISQRADPDRAPTVSSP